MSLVSAASGVVIKDGARKVWWFDSVVDVKLTAAETDGHLGLSRWSARRGASSPLHVHRREDEQFLLIEGTARFVFGEERFDASSGDIIRLPRHIPHAYLITSDRAELIGSVTPGGFEVFFTELGTPVKPGEQDGPTPTIPAMMAASATLGVEILGPPPTI